MMFPYAEIKKLYEKAKEKEKKDKKLTPAQRLEKARLELAKIKACNALD